jgi:elongator complex protein 3
MRTPLRKSHGKITFVLYNKPSFCGGNCVYCFTSKGFTKSTTANEDTILAKDTEWNGKLQLERRFDNYNLLKGSGIKCDLAVKGDSFASHDENYLRQFTKDIYDFLNGHESKNLEEAAKYQLFAKDKCVTYKIETRPDQIDEKKCRFFVELGVTTVEIGVQSLNDDVLSYNNRGHDAASVANATSLLRKYGFEVCYQMMVGLPGSTNEIDTAILSETLWEDQFSPDALKIYPCLLIKEKYAKQNQLHKIYNEKQWKPLNTDEYIALLKRCYPHIPKYVHINRIQRIIPEEKVEAGVSCEIDRKIFSTISSCLWQRSVANQLDNININFENYEIIFYSQGSNRFCFEAIYRKNISLGYARLDIVPNRYAIIRDIRVLGNMIPVTQKNIERKGCQHIGIGTSLLKAIEEMVLISKIESVFLKPSFGLVEWFEKRGYVQVNNYYLMKKIIGFK